ncbi:putative cytochrome P450 [Aulographum hederae CBS 113979]|uniref:Putative cytochrome P450 n=1 Tax=Aulographum hederae CBS 113979 TaxID=1176131 RepID=A0A6G1HBE9_9PEZI|nr:putative cytochrome P450 [Aulographum hederae CBS 113979]
MSTTWNGTIVKMEEAISTVNFFEAFFHAVLWKAVFYLLITLLTARLSKNYLRLRSERRKKISDSPVLGKPGDPSFGDALTAGYRKFHDTTFTIPTAFRPMVIIPPRFLDEIKALPENVLSFQKQVTERFLGKYTSLGVNDTLVHSVKVDLTKNIVNILKELQEETNFTVDLNIGDCPEWKPIPLYHTLSTLVAYLSGRIFVGLPLSRNPSWIKATLSYTLEGFVGSDKLWRYPKLFHPIAQYFIPELRNVHKYLAEGASFLRPIMEERREKKKQDPDYKPPLDMVQWITDNSDEENGKDVNYVSKTQMLISVVAIHTTSMTMAQAVFDLCSHPEYIEPLREEVEQVRAKHGDQWTKASIASLRKMDSFLKESQRFRPPGLVTMNRQCETDITLSTGLVLPKGTHIGVAAGANALDASFFPNADQFDGFRFERLRSLPGNESKYQFVTTSNVDQLHWGVGTHACPGRFFASYEIKMLLSRTLLMYEFRLPEGVGRPEDVLRDIRVIPNPMAVVEFRNRRSE